MNDCCEMIRTKLLEMRDLEYRAFNSKLIPNIDISTMIGIRVPVLRRFAKEFLKEDAKSVKFFLKCLPHRYFEENLLHVLLISQLKDFDEVIAYVDEFLPYIDNWALCDIFAPKMFKKHPDIVYLKIKEWLQSDDVYTVRFAIVISISNYLDEHFMPEFMELLCVLKSEEYYINIAIAWYMATALAKQYDTAIVYLEKERFSQWVHNKSIQKAIESARIDAKTKLYLKSLKIKNKNSKK